MYDTNLSTLPARDTFVHCNHNLCSSTTMVDTNPLQWNSKSVHHHISLNIYIIIHGMNTQGGFCDLAILTLKQMANRKFTLSSATKQKLNWLKAQWVNETCRNLQAKVIKTAAFCHNRALQDLYPDSYRLLFTTGSFTLTASPLSNEPDVQRVQRTEHEGRIETYSCLWSISLQERALELHYSRIEYYMLFSCD